MNNKVKSDLIEWIKTFSIALVCGIVITFVVQPTIVSGESMQPTLENKDYLIINKLAYENDIPKRGDIIVFKTKLIDNKSKKKKNLVKRVIALPGEHIVIKNSEVFINGEFLNESYIHGIYTYGDIDMVVPKNHVFTMGDNRPDSADSRMEEIGAISLDDVVGKVSLRLFPFDKVGDIE